MNDEAGRYISLPPLPGESLEGNLRGGRRGRSVVPVVQPLIGPIQAAVQALGMSKTAIDNQFRSGRWPASLRVLNGRVWLYDLQGIRDFLFGRKQETGV